MLLHGWPSARQLGCYLYILQQDINLQRRSGAGCWRTVLVTWRCLSRPRYSAGVVVSVVTKTAVLLGWACRAHRRKGFIWHPFLCMSRPGSDKVSHYRTASRCWTNTTRMAIACYRVFVKPPCEQLSSLSRSECVGNTCSHAESTGAASSCSSNTQECQDAHDQAGKLHTLRRSLTRLIATTPFEQPCQQHAPLSPWCITHGVLQGWARSAHASQCC
jgi:hypothetical protein